MKTLKVKKTARFLKRLAGNLLRQVPVIKSHHSLRSQSDCIYDAVQLVEECLVEGRFSLKSLSRRLRWRGIDLHGLPAGIRSDIFLVVSGQCATKQKIRFLENQLKILSSSALPCHQWLRLNELFCFKGRYPLAHLCREHARNLALQPFACSNAQPPISWANSIAAALEESEYIGHGDLRSALEKGGITGYEAKKWHVLLSVLNGEKVSKDELASFDESSYYEFVANKSVAIIGPAPTQQHDAKEIDSIDIVIRLNYSYSGKGTDSVHKGLRTDVSCFNGEQTTAFMSEMSGKLPKEIEWSCFKGQVYLLDVQVMNAGRKCRSLVMYDNMMTFHGSYNMLPLVVMDLAGFHCKSVKIFHSDLMLTVFRHKGYYPDSFNRDNSSMLQATRTSTILHDPVLQYRVLNRLWRQGKIVGDQRFEEVMEMGLDEYLKELECVYA